MDVAKHISSSEIINLHLDEIKQHPPSSMSFDIFDSNAPLWLVAAQLAEPAATERSNAEEEEHHNEKSNSALARAAS